MQFPEMLKIVLFSFLFFPHPVHVSLMSVEYSESANVLNVFLKVYSDDFILDYRMLTSDTSKIDFSSDNDYARRAISRYVKEKVQIFAEGTKLDSDVKSIVSSEGELKMEIVYNNKKAKSYIVRCQILTDIYNDQANLLIFRYGQYEEGIKLTPLKPEQIFRIK
jgi:hypothetical protein